jgi:hypothetical protein
VRLADGREFTVENLGPTQTVYDGEGVPIKQTIETDNGPELVVTPELVRGPRVAPPIVWRRRGGGFLEPGTEALLGYLQPGRCTTAAIAQRFSTSGPRTTSGEGKRPQTCDPRG